VKFLAILLGFGGYMLVYAAVAASGAFATEPWAGLFADAYGVSTSQGGFGTGSAATPGSVTGTVGSAASQVGQLGQQTVAAAGQTATSATGNVVQNVIKAIKGIL
jgi:hypothetical protein